MWLEALGLALAAYIAWTIGANDAANPTDTAVGSGALSLRKALLLFSAFAFAGAMLQGWMVMKTFGKGVAEITELWDAVAAAAATAAWVTLASLKGLPISTTHSAVGAVIGVALAKMLFLGYPEAINLGVLSAVVLSWVTSPLGAMALAALLYPLARRLYTHLGERADGVFRWLLIGALAYSAYSFGANDVGNAVGVYSAFAHVTGAAWFDPRALAALGSAGIMLGGLTVGRRVIQTVAFGITRLDLATGFAAELSNALVVWVFTTLPAMFFGYGMPISTTHASVSAVIGVGLAKYGRRGVDWGTIAKVVAGWVLTVPAAAVMAIAIRVAPAALGLV